MAGTQIRLLKAHIEHEKLGELGAVGVEDGALKDGQQGLPCLLGSPGLLVAAPGGKHVHTQRVRDSMCG